MNMITILTLATINAIVWYYFFYYLLLSIKTDIELKRAALVLLILFSLGIITCPIVLSHIACCMKMMMPEMELMK